jgi:uncharacterized protein (DUF488 family)
MIIYTIGFTKKNASDFFGLVKANKIAVMIDVRLNNSSQLAGFSKCPDIEYFLREICGCGYAHELIFAPSAELMEDFKSKKIKLAQYEKIYSELMDERKALDHFEKNYSQLDNVCLLCSEDTPANCHRRVLAELLLKIIAGASVKHL